MVRLRQINCAPIVCVLRGDVERVPLSLNEREYGDQPTSRIRFDPLQPLRCCRGLDSLESKPEREAVADGNLPILRACLV